MVLIELLLLIFSVSYSLFIVFILIGILRQSLIKESMTAEAGVSVIVPFKNEEKNLIHLLKSFSNQSYKKVEFIFVNDHSDDYSEKTIQSFEDQSLTISIIRLNQEEQGKKAAIEKGIDHAKFDFILTTDADCVHPANWIRTHLQLLQEAAVVTGSVEIRSNRSFWNVFQQMEMMAIQGISLGMGKLNLPISMSGANLSYEKRIFKSLDPYHSNSAVKSGDDIYFLQALKRNGIHILFSDHENIRVKTESSTFFGYFQQRIRWMRKGSSLSDFTTVLSGLLIFISSLQFIFITGYQLITQEYNQLFLISGGIKILVDFLLLFLVAHRWKKKSILIWFLPVFLISVLIHSLLPIFGWFIKVDWKGRKI